MITHNPLHRSGLALLMHPALALGDDAKSPQGIRMTDFWFWKPFLNVPFHSLPSQSRLLASTLERVVPVSSHLESKADDCLIVHGNSVVTDVPSNHRTQPFSHLWNWIMHSSLQLGFHFFQFCSEARGP